MAGNMNLNAEQLNNLTEDQVASIGEQIFNMMQGRGMSQQGQQQTRQQRMPMQSQARMQQKMPKAQQRPAQPPKMPASMSRGVKSVLQNRYGNLPNPQQMAMQQPMQMQQPMMQFAPQPQMYQPLYGQQQMQQRPFYAMNLNPYMMRG